MNTERLLKLAEKLDTVPEDRFDLSSWADDRFMPGDCGTTACAVGWACTIPEFNEAGLRLVYSPSGPFPQFVTSEVNYQWFTAAEKFFDLNFGEADYLFSSMCYVGADRTPSGVAGRIRSLVQQGSIIPSPAGLASA